MTERREPETERRFALDLKVAKLEAIVDELKEEFSDHNRDERSFWKSVHDDVTLIKEQMQRYQGLAGGAMIIIGALWAGISLFKDWILEHLK